LDPPRESINSGGAVGGTTWQTLVTDIAHYGGPALGLIALALYATVRYAYEGFYSELSIRPEEAGVDYITILTKAALGSIVVGTVFVLPAFTIGPSLVRFLRLHGSRYIAGGIVLTGGGAFGLFLDLNYPLDGASTDYSIDYGTAAFGLVIAIIGIVVMRTPSNGRSNQPSDLENVIATASAVVIIIVGLAFSSRYGEAIGRQVRDGQTAPSSLVVDFHTERVCVSWIGLDRPPTLDLSSPLI
jgi:hypothetical protein